MPRFAYRIEQFGGILAEGEPSMWPCCASCLPYPPYTETFILLIDLPCMHVLFQDVRPTVKLAAPVVAAQLAQASLGFVDTVMVGRLGAEALAAVALGNSVFFFLFIVGAGVIQAVNPMVAQAFGADTREPIARSVRQALWMGTLLGISAMALLWFIEPILLAVGQEPHTVSDAQAYLRAMLWGLIPAYWFMGMRGFVEAIGRPLPVTIIAVGGVGINILANGLLMYGWGPVPAMGIVGTGWASVIVFWSIFGALAVFVYRVPPFADYRVFDSLRRPDPSYFKELTRIGAPIGVARGVEAGLFMMTALMAGVLGADVLAAHQVALQCASLAFMVPLGIGIAGSVRVGQAAGREDPAGARRAGFTAMGCATVVMTASGLVFWLIPETIVSGFLDPTDPENQSVVSLAASLLLLAALFQVVDGIQIAASSALHGLKDTRIPMVIAFLTYWGVGLTTGYLFGIQGDAGAHGLWWGLVVGLTAAAIWLTWRFHRTVERAVRNRDIRASSSSSR